MSLPETFYKSYFPKDRERIFLAHLEYYYTHLLYKYDDIKMREFSSRASKNEAERKIRIELKACETLLVKLNSAFFKDKPITSSRKTKTIIGRMTVVHNDSFTSNH